MYAQIYWLTPEEGGRTVPLKPSLMTRKAYCATTQAKNGSAWSVCVCFDSDADIYPGTSNKYEIKFLVPEGARQFATGDALYICEGRRLVARGAIL